MQVPLIPNQPLLQAERGPMGPLQLRRHVRLGLLENSAFDPDRLDFDISYIATQAASPTFVEHMRGAVRLIRQAVTDRPRPRIIEIGCGKGEFLDLLLEEGFDAYGFDTSYQGNDPRIQKRRIADNESLQADVIVMRYVLDYITAPHSYLGRLSEACAGGLIYIEGPRLEFTLERQNFHDICYEQPNYFTSHCMRILYPQAIAHGDCFGGAYQYTMARLDGFSKEFAKLYAEGPWEYVAFEELFPSVLDRLNQIQERLGQDTQIFIWGSARKGVMFAYHCARLGRLIERIIGVVDINPARWGKFLPGTGLKIVPPEVFYERTKPGDVLVIVNGNYRAEILDGLAAHNVRGLMVETL